MQDVGHSYGIKFQNFDPVAGILKGHSPNTPNQVSIQITDVDIIGIFRHDVTGQARPVGKTFGLQRCHNFNSVSITIGHIDLVISAQSPYSNHRKMY